jgi:hypothetical protein
MVIDIAMISHDSMAIILLGWGDDSSRFDLLHSADVPGDCPHARCTSKNAFAQDLGEVPSDNHT